MPDATTIIPEELMRARLEQAEQMREFFIAMWLQNPALAKGGGERLQALLRPLAAVSPAPGAIGR
jgi:hypothetical protein